MRPDPPARLVRPVPQAKPVRLGRQAREPQVAPVPPARQVPRVTQVPPVPAGQRATPEPQAHPARPGLQVRRAALPDRPELQARPEPQARPAQRARPGLQVIRVVLRTDWTDRPNRCYWTPWTDGRHGTNGRHGRYWPVRREWATRSCRGVASGTVSTGSTVYVALGGGRRWTQIIPASGKVLVILTGELSGSNTNTTAFMSVSISNSNAFDTNSLRVTGSDPVQASVTVLIAGLTWTHPPIHRRVQDGRHRHRDVQCETDHRDPACGYHRERVPWLRDADRSARFVRTESAPPSAQP